MGNDNEKYYVGSKPASMVRIFRFRRGPSQDALGATKALKASLVCRIPGVMILRRENPGSLI